MTISNIILGFIMATLVVLMTFQFGRAIIRTDELRDELRQTRAELWLANERNQHLETTLAQGGGNE